LSGGSAAGDPLHRHKTNTTALRPVFLRAGYTESHKIKSLCELGRGKGIVFSPDLSEPGNREFFRALGFAYFEDPDWRKVVDQVKAYNRAHPESPIETLLIQSH